MIKPKTKHFRHPLRTIAAARDLCAMYLDIKRTGDRSSRRYLGDARYDLDNVSKGFASRFEDPSSDSEILERVCAAYRRAVERERSAPEVYRATAWWQQIRMAALGPLTRALAAGDITSLRRMYRNFFRDPCSTGLIGVPFSMSGAYFQGRIKNLHRRYFLGDALYAIDYWQSQTAGRFSLRDLAAPLIGNPYGVVFEGVLVRAGAAFQHYSAWRVAECLGSSRAAVVEVGGGFGGMAYYLLRDRSEITYLDFDVPESLALTAYYLMTAFPHLRFLLYGEAAVSSQSLSRADVALMPLCEMESLSAGSAGVVFSSHAISDISHTAMNIYLETIARIACGCFLYFGNARGAEAIRGLAVHGRPLFRFDELRPSAWNAHRSPGFDEVECRFAPQAALAALPCAAHVN